MITMNIITKGESVDRYIEFLIVLIDHILIKVQCKEKHFHIF